MFNNSSRLGRLALIVPVLLSVIVTGAIASPVSATPPPPDNDNIANATVLDPSASTRTVSGTNVEATFEEGESLLADDLWAATQTSVWYSLVAPAGMVEIDTEGSDLDTVLAVFQFDSISGFSGSQLIVLNDDRDGATTSKLAFQADGTTTYYIAVSGFSGSSGNFELNWNYPTAATNDLINNAVELSPSGETRRSQNNFSTTVFFDEMNYMRTQGLNEVWNHSVWFKVRPAAGYFGVRLEGHVSAHLIIIDSDDFDNIGMMTSGPNGNSFEADGSTMYYIGVGGGANAIEQSFDLISEPLTQIGVVQNVEVVGGETTIVTWDPPTGFDPAIHHYYASFSNGTSEHSCSPRSTSRCEFVRVPPGTWTLDVVAYEILYGFYGVYHVDNNVQLTHVTNDSFTSAELLPSDSGELNDYFDRATLEIGEPTHGAIAQYSSLWYAYTPSTTGTSTFTIEPREVDWTEQMFPMVATYRGSEISSLTQINSSTSSVSLDVVAGQRYYIAAVSARDYSEYGWIEGGEARFTLTWSHVAAPPEITTPSTPTTVATPNIKTVKAKNNATMASILKKAKIKVPKNAKVTYTIAKASKKKCSVVRSRIQLKKKITCSMTVKIKPKKGKTISHKLAIIRNP